jgi:hypothetical protein
LQGPRRFGVGLAQFGQIGGDVDLPGGGDGGLPGRLSTRISASMKALRAASTVASAASQSR